MQIRRWFSTDCSELQSRVLNRRFADLGKAVKVIIAENKVRAIMSMEYAFIPTNQVVREVLKTVEQRFGDFEMVGNQIDTISHVLKSRCPFSRKTSIGFTACLMSLPQGYW